MALKLSSVRRAGHTAHIGKWADNNLYEIVAPKKYQKLIPPIVTTGAIGLPDGTAPYFRQATDRCAPEGATNGFCAQLAKGKNLRGSGLNGPEDHRMMRLVLYNRMKMKTPQRVVPHLDEEKAFFSLESSIMWFGFSHLLLYVPLMAWAKRYAMKNGHYPWVPARTDGTPGVGPIFWFLE